MSSFDHCCKLINAQYSSFIGAKRKLGDISEDPDDDRIKLIDQIIQFLNEMLNEAIKEKNEIKNNNEQHSYYDSFIEYDRFGNVIKDTFSLLFLHKEISKEQDKDYKRFLVHFKRQLLKKFETEMIKFDIDDIFFNMSELMIEFNKIFGFDTFFDVSKIQKDIEFEMEKKKLFEEAQEKRKKKKIEEIDIIFFEDYNETEQRFQNMKDRFVKYSKYEMIVMLKKKDVDLKIENIKGFKTFFSFKKFLNDVFIVEDKIYLETRISIISNDEDTFWDLTLVVWNFESDIFNIHYFQTYPKHEKNKENIVKYMSTKLNENSIKILIHNIINEDMYFWDKMKQKGYISNYFLRTHLRFRFIGDLSVFKKIEYENFLKKFKKNQNNDYDKIFMDDKFLKKFDLNEQNQIEFMQEKKIFLMEKRNTYLNGISILNMIVRINGLHIEVFDHNSTENKNTIFEFWKDLYTINNKVILKIYGIFDKFSKHTKNLISLENALYIKYWGTASVFFGGEGVVFFTDFFYDIFPYQDKFEKPEKINDVDEFKKNFEKRFVKNPSAPFVDVFHKNPTNTHYFVLNTEEYFIEMNLIIDEIIYVSYLIMQPMKFNVLKDMFSKIKKFSKKKISVHNVPTMYLKEYSILLDDKVIDYFFHENEHKYTYKIKEISGFDNFYQLYSNSKKYDESVLHNKKEPDDWIPFLSQTSKYFEKGKFLLRLIFFCMEKKFYIYEYSIFPKTFKNNKIFVKQIKTELPTVEIISIFKNFEKKFKKEFISSKYSYKNDLGKILLTTPHSFCINKENKNHTCDLLALEAAKHIKSNNNDMIKIIKGDISRTICDLNRIECRHKLFRKKIRKYVSENNNVEFVLDIHSFPNKSNPNLEIYILDDYIDKPKKYSVQFVEFMSDNNVKVKLLKGIKNDIHEEMRELGLKSFLIEFNESLKEDRLIEITNFIYKFAMN